MIKELEGKVIVSISLGYYHAAAIDSLGVVYTWGRGINGQLGHGSIINEDTVRGVQNLKE